MGKVLLIDDDPVTQLYCKQILEKANYEIETATDAFEAITKARVQHFDYIIVDLVLPGPLNGVDVIKEIRSIMPSATIVAYSGFSDEGITEKVVYAGADNFITKPFKPDELLSALQNKKYGTINPLNINQVN